MSKRKRGPRPKHNPGKNMRNAKKARALREQQLATQTQAACALSVGQGESLVQAKAASAPDAQLACQAQAQTAHAFEAEQDNEVPPSVESESEVQAAIDEALSLNPVATASTSAARPTTPVVDDDEEEENCEVSWSRSPSTHIHSPHHAQAQPREAIDLCLQPVQPIGDFCIVICRLSSGKKAPADPKVPRTSRELGDAYIARRETEGEILADRLASNCPSPVIFEEVYSYCGIRHSGHTADYVNPAASASAWVKRIRSIIHKVPEQRKVTILVRAVDGITTDHPTLKSFLQFIKGCNIVAQLIFQWNKVCDDIRPMLLRNFKGLGGSADFMAEDLLDHLEGRQDIPEVQRLLDILLWVESNKGRQQGIQDRNALPAADILAADEVQSVSNNLVGRKRLKT